MATVLNPANKAFVVYMAHLKAKILIYLAWKAQITLLLTKKDIVLAKYLDFTDVFSKKSAIKLF